ncbi:hypothetical protein BLOT_015361 [Blomia tropicalis]|nr:hypothetical protein BLOT_015361 [Blomia tropicalis]
MFWFMFKNSKSLERYTSNQTIHQYLRNELCSIDSAQTTKWIRILVSLSPDVSNRFIQDYSHCFDVIVYDVIEHPTELFRLVGINGQFKLKKRFILFNDESIQTETIFQQRIKLFEQVYDECYYSCLPFVVRLASPQNNLVQVNKWIGRLNDTSSSLSLTLVIDQPITKNQNVIYLRPILDGCYRYPHWFHPNKPIDYQRLRIKYKFCDMNYRHLNVAVSDSMPFCHLIRNHLDGTIKFGLDYMAETYLLQMLEKRFHFYSRLIDANQIWDAKRSNGQWTVDFGICSITRSYERSQYVDFTHFTFDDQLKFITLKPKIKSRKWIISKPFSTILWLLIFLSLLTLSTTIFLIAMFQASIQQFSSIDSFIKSIWIIFSAMSNQSIHSKRKSLKSCPLRIVFGVWITMTLVLTTSYSSIFYSILTIPEYEKPIDDIEDALEFMERDSRTTIFTSAIYYKHFMKAKPNNQLYYSLGQYIKNTNNKTIVLKGRVKTLLFNHLSTIPVIIIQTAYYGAGLQKLCGTDCFHVSSTDINQDTVSIALPKGSVLLQPFNMAIQQFYEMGIPRKLLRLTFEKIPLVDKALVSKIQPEQLDSIHHIRMKDLYSVYLIWLIGIGLSLIVFCLEIYFKFLILRYNNYGTETPIN